MIAKRLSRVNLNDFDPTGTLESLGGLRDAALNLPSSTGAPSIIGKAARMVCDGWKGSPVANLPTVAGAILDAQCKPYYDQSGAVPPSRQPAGFEGGQCPNVSYNVTWERYVVSTGQVLQAQTNGRLGAIGGVEYKDVDDPFGRLQAYQRVGIGTDTPSEAPFALVQSDQAVRITNVVRADGLPDLCGNPPPVLVPGSGGNTYNYGDTVTHNAGGTTNNVNIKVDAPYVNEDGDFIVPVTINADPEFNLFGGGPSPEAGQAPSEPLVAQPPIPGSELEANGGEFPEPPEGQEYVGALFRLTEYPVEQAPLTGSEPVAVFARTVGNARLKMRSANSVESLTTNHQWREESFSLYRPDPGLTVKGAYANVIPYFQYEVIPLTVSTEA